MSDLVFVAGVGMTPFGRLPERSVYDMVGEAVTLALKDAGAEAADIGSAFYATLTNGLFQGQTAIPGPIAMRRLEGIPVFSVENACASGSSAFNLAVQALRAGTCDVALAVGAEKMNIADKDRMFAAFDGGWDVSTVDENKKTLLALGEGVEPPPGTVSDRPYSVFMDVYAAIARNHMKRYGTTQHQIAAVAAKNHQHSVHNPLAQFQQAMTIEQVLASPPITYPLTTTIQTGTTRSLDEPQKIIAHLAAMKAYEQAGVAPRDVDVAEVHDASAIGEILNAESLMLVPFGEGGPAAERGDFTVGGRIPINPSGGLESKGHPIGATGLGQIHELVTQLRCEAAQRQVQGARIAIQENGGGLYGIEEAVVGVNILARQ